MGNLFELQAAAVWEKKKQEEDVYLTQNPTLPENPEVINAGAWPPTHNIYNELQTTKLHSTAFYILTDTKKTH